MGYALDEKNADLFAAAPALLAACEAANVALRDLSGLSTGDSAIWNKGGTGYEAFVLIQAAILKAEGRKP